MDSKSSQKRTTTSLKVNGLRYCSQYASHSKNDILFLGSEQDLAESDSVDKFKKYGSWQGLFTSTVTMALPQCLLNISTTTSL